MVRAEKELLKQNMIAAALILFSVVVWLLMGPTSYSSSAIPIAYFLLVFFAFAGFDRYIGSSSEKNYLNERS